MSAGELALIQSFHEDGMAPTREKGVATIGRTTNLPGVLTRLTAWLESLVLVCAGQVSPTFMAWVAHYETV